MGVIMMLIGAVYPLLELFDRWDTPGLSNDTELKMYALLFAISLAFLLCRLISWGSLTFSFLSWPILRPDLIVRPLESGQIFIFAIPPLFDLPLRI